MTVHALRIRVESGHRRRGWPRDGRRGGLASTDAWADGEGGQRTAARRALLKRRWRGVARWDGFAAAHSLALFSRSESPQKEQNHLLPLSVVFPTNQRIKLLFHEVSEVQ